MRKLFFKLFILLFLMISIPMFTLIEIQRQNQMKTMTMPMSYPMMNMPHHQMPRPQAPPIEIPVMVICTISGILSFLFITYLSKNYIIPLFEIQNKITEVKNENFDIVFNTNNNNPSIKSLLKL